MVRPRVYQYIPRIKLGVLLAAPLVVGYVWLGGMSVSLLRAAIMFGFWGAFILAGRSRVLLDGLFCALALLLIVSPMALFDIGLQMSALAVGGIGLTAPVLRRGFDSLFRETPVRRILSAPLASAMVLALVCSVCATGALLPLMLANFGSVSVSLYWNALWLPVLAWVVMPLGVAGLLLAGFGWTSGAAWALAIPAWLSGTLLETLTRLYEAGSLPERAGLGPQAPAVIGYYALALLLLVLVQRRRLVSSARATLWAACCLALLAGPWAWREVVHTKPAAEFTMLDVGHGLAQVLEVGGARIVIDGGGFRSSSFDVGEAIVAPNLTVGRRPHIDLMVCSHPDQDHAGGLAYLLRAFSVEELVTGGLHLDESAGVRMMQAAAASSVATSCWSAGDVRDLGEGFRLEVLHPSADFCGDANESSLVLRLVKDGAGLALLPGDADEKAVAELLDSGRDLRAQILVLPHHGSEIARETEFLRAVQPTAALVSTSAGSSFKLPSQKVVQALQAANVPLYDTAQCGEVRAVWPTAGDSPVVSSFLSCGPF